MHLRIPGPSSTALLFGGLTFLTAACGDTASSGIVAMDAGAHEDAPRAKVVHDSGTSDAKTRDVEMEADTATAERDSGVDGTAKDTGTEAAVTPPRNHGDASSQYPAFTPDVPTVQDQGGPTLGAPEIVTVTWPNEPNATALESFGDDIGHSVYWTDTTSEYGVGPATSGPADHVRLTEAAINAWSDTELASWLSDHVASYAQYGLPAPTGNSIYTLYLSTATDLTVSGSDGCQQGIGGYHSSFVLDGRDVSYAVILQCNGADLKSATSSASHELIEASTDPHPNDVAAYYGFDEAHLAWDVFQSFQDEVADACEFYYGPNGAFFLNSFAVIEAADAGADGGDAGLVADAGTLSFDVQRSWSNVSAAAGHAPCVPAVAGPYYAVTPLDMVNISLNLAPIGGGSNAQTQGYAIAKGATKTFPVGFRSDGPTSGPWTISASEGNPLLGGSQGSHITVSIDTPTGQNGDIAYVTVTVNAIDTSMNGELLTITSQLPGGVRTYVPILISNE